MTPDEYTVQESFLDVGDGHELYIHEWGNRKSKAAPILYLHGGPGGGCDDRNKQWFDPTRQHVIFFDQRGSGRSLPKGSLDHNTTPDLVSDISKILKHLKIEKVVLTGGSWGVCLALAFALEHPGKVEAMVLCGIFTGSQNEIDYFDRGDFRAFFPDVWEWYLSRTPKSHHKNPTRYHYANILGSEPQAALDSAYTYENLEGGLVRLDERFAPSNPDEYDSSDITIEVHYLANHCFLPSDHILKNASKLRMPVWLVQGRYDFVCPPETAYRLHKTLPDSHLIWTVAGHSPGDRNTWDVMRALLSRIGE